MEILRRFVVLGISAVGIVVPFRGAGDRGAPAVISARPVTKTSPSAYATSAKEHYLTTDQFGYIRPGFNITVNGVAVGADRKVVADITYTDDANQPLDRAGQVTPGALSFSFVLAWWDPVLRQYTSYTTRPATSLPDSPIQQTVTQAGADGAGAAGFNDISLGHSTYTFKTVLPASYDATKTTTLGIYATRNLTDIAGKNYYANAEFDFRPDAQPVADKWDMIDTAACNNCHNPLSAHGGSRQDVRLCVLCHSPQSVNPDTGNTVDFKVLIHKIHDGANLPSVVAGTPYQIINSHGKSDFSTVMFPQDIRNCTKCHAAPATQATNYYTFPNQAACGSCHDDVNFATGANHPGGIQLNDGACASCHQPQGDTEFDASILGAHTIPLKSTQLKGLNAEILSVTNTAPGQHPTVTFKLSNGDGTPVDPKPFGSSLNLLLGGPTAEYAINPFRERADGSAFDGTQAVYTFTAAIPADATGTWTVSIEARRTVTIAGGSNPDGSARTFSVTEGATNPIFYAAVTDATPQPRRQVVDIDKCNVCHDRLALHGGQRFVVNECVICHNPNATDVSQRPADVGSPESISFQRLVHRIHRGESLTHDYTIYGFMGSVNNFNDIRFPGDLRDCEKCHVNGSQQLPLPATNLAVQTPPPPQEWFTPMRTTAAACLGCHDTEEAAAHAYVMTAPFGESCAACHAPDDDFSVDKVHAR
jgi:OmcA/MtrC family decaheme c-type cytochrome